MAAYVLWTLRGKKMSEVTREGAERLTPQELSEKEREKDPSDGYDLSYIWNGQIQQNIFTQMKLVEKS